MCRRAVNPNYILKQPVNYAIVDNPFRINIKPEKTGNVQNNTVTQNQNKTLQSYLKVVFFSRNNYGIKSPLKLQNSFTCLFRHPHLREATSFQTAIKEEILSPFNERQKKNIQCR